MKIDHLKYLRCPKTYRTLFLDKKEVVGDRVKSGTLVEEVSGFKYPIVNFIPRFVDKENYASNFGFQWKTHNKTQYDHVSKFDISGERFRNETKWEANLEGQFVLEVGCGSGRFTKHAIETNAMVVSFDYSSAVEENYNSNGESDNLLIVQANIYEMPFPHNFFHKAYCFGVLQHTPDPEQSFLSIVKFLRSQGDIASDVYKKSLSGWLLQTKYYARYFTKEMEPKDLYRNVVKYIDFMWPIASIIRKIPKIGTAINYRLLIADHSRTLLNADNETLKQWAYLDTMDMLSPKYDYPQTLHTFKRWHENARLVDIDVHYGYNGVEGRGKKI